MIRATVRAARWDSVARGVDWRVVAALIALSGAFTAVVVSGALDAMDHAVTRDIDGLANHTLDVVCGIAAITASAGASVLWVLVALGAALRSPRRRPLLLAGVALLVAVSLLELALKVAIAHPGPQSTRTPGSLVGGPLLPTRGSYPSGHMARAILMVVVPLLALMRPGQRRAAVALAVLWCTLIFWTRIYLEDHWLSDAIGGVLIALAALPVLASAAALGWVAPPGASAAAEGQTMPG